VLSAIALLLHPVVRTGPDHEPTGDTPGYGVATLPVWSGLLL